MPGHDDTGLEFANSIAAQELYVNMTRREIKKVGDQFGYGLLMHEAQNLWRESLIENDFPSGGEFAVGPCVALTVPCGCEHPHECDWCCGCGWLTKHVKEIKDGHENHAYE